MNPHFTYLFIDLGTLLFPLLLSFDKKVAFYKNWLLLFTGILIVGGGFVIWDAIFTDAGIWSFNPQYILGISAFKLPLEEWLFFIVVPYACCFIYACMAAYFPKLEKRSFGFKVLLGLGVLLLAITAFNYPKAYTFWALGLCGWLCLAVYFFRSRLTNFQPTTFLISYSIALVPFFLVNGLLTSLPVVEYNDAQNLGIRIGSVPMEDAAYGMLLILGVSLFLVLKKPNLEREVMG